MRSRFALALAATLAICAPPALAQSAPERMEKAEGLLSQAKPLEALDEAHAAYLDLWQRMPLMLRRSALVQEPARGRGAYQERTEAIYAPGELIYLYVEPVGYGWREPAEGRFQTDFSVDVAINDRAGRTLIGQNGFDELRNLASARTAEFYANITYQFSRIPPGKYTLVTRLNDRVTSKSVTTEHDFEIAR